MTTSPFVSFILMLVVIYSCSGPTKTKDLKTNKLDHVITKPQDFLFTKMSAADIDSVEPLKYSTKYIYEYPIGVSTDYFPNRKLFKLSQPIVYRKNLGKYFLETSYYFSTPDNNLRLVEYWWRDTTYSSDFADTLIERNKSILYSRFNNSGTQYPENENEGKRTIWEDSAVYVKQFPVSDGVRIIISWK